MEEGEEFDLGGYRLVSPLHSPPSAAIRYAAPPASQISKSSRVASQVMFDDLIGMYKSQKTLIWVLIGLVSVVLVALVATIVITLALNFLPKGQPEQVAEEKKEQVEVEEEVEAAEEDDEEWSKKVEEEGDAADQDEIDLIETLIRQKEQRIKNLPFFQPTEPRSLKTKKSY